MIPGGTPAAAHLHVCRTVCRRAERRTIAVGEEVNPEVVRYLNRLSDLLFILSRAANVAPGEAGAQSRCGARAHTAAAPRHPPPRRLSSAPRARECFVGQRRSAARRPATASAVQKVATR